MANRPDLRDITTDIREALADCDRDELMSMLTFLFREYVVDGPPPMLLHQTESLEELAGLSFAELIAALQARLDHPELSLFGVEGGRVTVKLQGVAHPLVAQPRAAEPLPPPPSEVRTEPSQLPQPAPSRGAVDEARARGRGDLAGEARGPAAAEMPRAEAPRPSRGLSMRGTPTGGGSPGAPAPTAAPAAPAAPTAAPPSQGPAGPDSAGGDDDDSAARFSLLELD